MTASFQIAFRLIPLLSVLSVLILSGCSATQQSAHPSFNTQQSAAQANQVLQAANPVGSKLKATQNSLEEMGFHCQELRTPKPEYRTSMLCTLSPVVANSASPVAAPAVSVTWMVEIHSVDGASLTKLKANRIPKDIGE